MSFDPARNSVATHCARPIRGCATDEQYCDVVDRIETALIGARQEGIADLAGAIKKIYPDIATAIVGRWQGSDASMEDLIRALRGHV